MLPLKEVQRNVHKKPYFILIILRRIYIVMYKHSLCIGLRKISTWNSVAIFFFLSYAREKEKKTKILALCLKSNDPIARIW